MYEQTVAPLVDNFVKGYNATILAYGQTGSGKTHTMGTACGEVVDVDVDTSTSSLNEPQINQHQASEHDGIIPRALQVLCNQISQAPEGQYVLNVSFLEIYKDSIHDLLKDAKVNNNTSSSSSSDNTPPVIREDCNGQIYIKGMSEHHVTNINDIIQLLQHGSLHRTTGIYHF